ncbi:MAG: hypothetical protein Q9227_001815 [Pyrenula ochraceoflavens]
MGPFNDNLFKPSPAMVLPLQGQQLPSPQLSASLDGNIVEDQSMFPPAQPSPTSFANFSSSWTPISTSAPISTNPSRKRSRDETSFDSALDGSYFPPSQQVSTPAPIPEEEPVYGEGMVLLNPRTGMSISAESQTGTWYEEKTEAEKQPTRAESFGQEEPRPDLLSRKSQRLDLSAPPLTAGLDDIAQKALPASPPKTAVSTAEPKVDEFTIALGIGWNKIDTDDEAKLAAVRGWTRYIENHFSNGVRAPVEILAKSEGLNAYLVQSSSDGFFLFSDNLSEGQFVAEHWEAAIRNLRSVPIMFDGAIPLRAAEKTPAPDARPVPPPATELATEANGMNSTEGMDID